MLHICGIKVEIIDHIKVGVVYGRLKDCSEKIFITIFLWIYPNEVGFGKVHNMINSWRTDKKRTQCAELATLRTIPH